MTVLFDRYWRVTIAADGIEKSWGRWEPKMVGIDISGSVTKTSDGTPNELDLQMFNLSPDSRKFISKKGMTVHVEAGYPGLFGTIFRGEIEIPQHYKDGTDRITEIKAKDGAFLLRNIKESKSFEKDTEVVDILNDMLNSLLNDGVSGSSIAEVEKLRAGVIKTESASGKKVKRAKVVIGSTIEALKKTAAAYNLIVDVTDKKINIYSPTDTLNQGETILLDSASGLISIPEPLDEDKGWHFVSLLRHEMNPAYQFVCKSEEEKQANGNFVIDEIKHTFDSRGSNWYTEIEARPL